MNPKLSNTGVVNIRGKEYETVALRLQKFRSVNPTWSLLTKILIRDAEWVVMLAEIRDGSDRLLATGHAEENRKSSQINQTSALENCETSAIGRALAALGFGGTEFASANEVTNAVHQQQTPQTPPPPKHDAKVLALINDCQTLTELQDAWRDLLSADERRLHADIKDKRKAELEAKAATDEFVAEMEAHSK